jgi:uncharacterized membrane protein
VGTLPMTENHSLEHAGPAAEAAVIWAVQWLKLGIETIGAVIIAIGIAVALLQLIRAFVARKTAGFTAIRLTLARYLALALEFQLGADILSTAIAPSWDQIGKLGAIAVIRTGLNFFLSLEMNQEGEIAEAEKRSLSASASKIS